LRCCLQNGAQPGTYLRDQGGDDRRFRSRCPRRKISEIHHVLPIPCMHCSEPPCLPACPVEAITRRQDGFVLIDEEICDGCQQCLEACPYDVPVYDSQKGKAWKCMLCAHRVDQGLEPFCVSCSEMEAMFFGDISYSFSHVSQLITQREAYTLKSEPGRGPAVYYYSPESSQGRRFRKKSVYRSIGSRP